MKRIAVAAAIVLGIFVAQISQVEAYDYHVGEWNGGWNAYLMTETIQIKSREYMDYSCRVKAVRGNDVIYVSYNFWEDRSRRLIEHFTNDQGHSGMFTVSDANGFYIEYNIDDYVSRNYYE